MAEGEGNVGGEGAGDTPDTGQGSQANTAHVVNVGAQGGPH